MFMAFSKETNKYEDVVCKKKLHPSGFIYYLVFLGQTHIGQISNRGKQFGWTAISSVREPGGFRMVAGLHRKWQSIEYLLRCYDPDRPA